MDGCAVRWNYVIEVGLLLAVVASVQAEDSTPFVLAGPQGAARKDVDACAKALTARCKDFGYEGVAAKTIDVKDPAVKGGTVFRVEVSCATGITPKMVEKITAFANTPCKDAVLRFERELSEREAEQFVPDKGTAPKGATWTKIKVAWDGGGEQTVLLLDSPAVKMINNVVWHRSGDLTGPYGSAEPATYEFSASASKTIAAQAGGSGKNLPVYFIVDGVAR